MEFSGNYFKTFLNVCLDHMKSFIKIGVLVFEKKNGQQADRHSFIIIRIPRSLSAPLEFTNIPQRLFDPLELLRILKTPNDLLEHIKTT